MYFLSRDYQTSNTYYPTLFLVDVKKGEIWNSSGHGPVELENVV
jgi:hypothetical protein